MPRKTASRATPEAAPRLRIGAVSRLTRIPADTLRAWERRYGVVAPRRADSAARLYGTDDVERLRCIKRLVDAGHAIGSVATLSRRKLEAMLALHDGAATAPAAQRDAIAALNVVAFGDSFPPLDVERLQAGGVTLLGPHAQWDAFEAAVAEHAPHAIVVEVGALLPEHVERILALTWQSRAARTLVFYGFASADLVERLVGEGVVAVRAPVELALLMRELGRVHRGAGDPTRHGLPDHGVPSSPLFEPRALAEMAGRATSIKCECPRHLVALIRMLTQFERYSAACAHRNEEDAALHLSLRARAAHARATMEQALVALAEHEGIALPSGNGVRVRSG